MLKQTKYRILKFSLFSLLILTIISVSVDLLYDLWLTSVHTTIPGQVYRSPQLSPNQLKQIIKKYHLRAIVNLRGENKNASWYQQEMKLTHQMHVKQYNISLSSHDSQDVYDLSLLTYTLSHAEKPYLIHCRNGSDRSGLAAAIALILNNETSLSKIQKQYSWHFLVFSPKSAGHQVFPLYFAWLKKNNWQSSRNRFLKWINSDYYIQNMYVL